MSVIQRQKDRRHISRFRLQKRPVSVEQRGNLRCLAFLDALNQLLGFHTSHLRAATVTDASRILRILLGGEMHRPAPFLITLFHDGESSQTLRILRAFARRARRWHPMRALLLPLRGARFCSAIVRVSRYAWSAQSARGTKTVTHP